jgi:capsular polysaccharide biosynthesis protein
MIDMENYPKQSSHAAADEDAYVLPISDLFLIFRKRWWVIVLMMIALTGASVGYSVMQPPVYESSIKILVGQERGIVEQPIDVNGLQDLTKTVAEAINSRPIAQAVIEQENLRTDPVTLLNNLEVVAIEETQFVAVSYRDSDPQRARRVVDVVGDVFSTRFSEENERGSVITATVWEPAGPAGGAISPKPLRNGLLALMIGAVLGTVLAFLLEFMDDSWRSPAEAEQVSGVPTFGVIPSVPEDVRGGAEVLVRDANRGKGP